MLPMKRHLIEFIKGRLFLLIRIRVGNFGCSRSAKVIQVLQMAIKEVAVRVINSAWVLVYEVF